jgi:CheY-like chemotaxis protein
LAPDGTIAAKILVVDDEDLTRTNLSLFLRDEGYKVRDAACGAEALSALAGEAFDLVITDFIMPHVDGIRLTDLIHAKWPTVPVVLVTAYLSARGGNTILGGKAQVISKPIDLQELLGTVKRILQ